MHTAKKIGLIAGRGALPIKVSQSLIANAKAPAVVVLKNIACASNFETIDHKVIPLGKVGQMVQFFKDMNITELVFAGGLDRPSFSSLGLDLKGVKWLAKIGLKAVGDDGLFQGIIKLLKEEGFTVKGVHEICPELLAAEGLLAGPKLSETDMTDLARGIEAAKALGAVDVGQAVVVENGVVLSLEGVEGTKELINRTQALKREKHCGLLLKAAKPQQIKQIDLPTIGPETIEQVARIGLKGVAIEAGSALIIDLEKVKALAQKLKIFVYGFKV